MVKLNGKIYGAGGNQTPEIQQNLFPASNSSSGSF
jgi:hypothetical protein